MGYINHDTTALGGSAASLTPPAAREKKCSLPSLLGEESAERTHLTR